MWKQTFCLQYFFLLLNIYEPLLLQFIKRTENVKNKRQKVNLLIINMNLIAIYFCINSDIFWQ